MSKRIVFVQSGLGAGGAEKIINLIARHRAEQGDQVFVLAFHDAPQDSYFDYPPCVTVRTMQQDGLGVKAGWMGVIQQVKWLRWAVKEIQPELLISFLTKINVISSFALIGQTPIFLVSERNNPIRQRPGRIWNALIAFMFKRADRIVMQTNGAKSILSAKMHKKAYVIPNPCHVTKIATNKNHKPTDVVAVGRLTYQKGFDLLIDAFVKVTAKHPKAKLTIWGEGQDRAKLERLIVTKGLSENIKLPGVTKRSMEWVGSADIFVLPSRYEGFPNVLAEAMAAGLATVAFDCDWGPSDLIINRENGILVPLENTAALSKNILAVMDNQNFRAMLGRNAKKNMDQFSRNTILAQWDNAIDTPS